MAARFFTPQIGGAGAAAARGVFRIDHDEQFNQTTHLQYQPSLPGPWIGFNWRYDSGLVAGSVPCYGGPDNDCPQAITDAGQPAILMEDPFGNPLSADQEFEAGFFCGASHATPPSPGNPMGTFITSSLPAVGRSDRVPGIRVWLDADFGAEAKHRK